MFVAIREEKLMPSGLKINGINVPHSTSLSQPNVSVGCVSNKLRGAVATVLFKDKRRATGQLIVDRLGQMQIRVEGLRLR